MQKFRITTRVVLLGIALHLGLRTIILLPVGLGNAAQHAFALDVLRVLGSCFAYGLAFLVCWRIAAEYRETKWMRLAWLALTLNAGLSLLRPFVRPLPIWGQPIELYDTPPKYALLMHCILVPANFCLLLGLLAIWWAYHEIGLGFRLGKRDILAVLALLALMVTFFVFGDLLTEAQAYYRATTILQVVAQVQMFLIAAASLLLHRVSVQMGSGRLAIALRWMTIYALWRLGMVLLVSLARHAFPNRATFIADVAQFGWQLAPWIFALAVVHRAELTDLAAEGLAHIRRERPTMPSLQATRTGG
ncbi:MAG: hypothetical protein ACKVZH_20805 [Blastocatellia bacterium]